MNHTERSDETRLFADAVLEGLRREPKTLSPKFLYDARGSEIFEEICGCPEYYVTRTEISILRERAAAIADLLGSQPVIFELGSGASLKTRVLLDAVQAAAYIPVDISRTVLLESSSRLREIYPGLTILPVCADFTASWSPPESELPWDAGRRVVFFPGSTIGNFEPAEALTFMKGLRPFLRPEDFLLIGVDLVKPREILEPAYDDAQGITARFDLNLLHRMKKELGANIDPDGFRHHAFFNEDKSRVEMHLVSLCQQDVWVLGSRFSFEPGESIHTECSYKYSPAQLVSLAERAGFEKRELWTDTQALFGVGLFEVR